MKSKAERIDEGFESRIIADSVSPLGIRLTTFLITFPRIILAEFNTHRMFSRNSASSRAIPFKKMLKRVEENPFIPIAFQKDHAGMQGTEYLEGADHTMADIRWRHARQAAMFHAERLSNELGVTKQICNRLLEPFLWHTVCVTATEWENFFALRAHDAAEIHIQKIAYMMLECYNESTPDSLEYYDWHLPFWEEDMADLPIDEQKKICTARVARTSYLNFDNTRDFEEDYKLHDRLAAAGHWSPFEQIAIPMVNTKRLGNFRGWVQYRKEFENENRADRRVISK